MPIDSKEYPLIFNSTLYKKGSFWLATPEELQRDSRMDAEEQLVKAHKQRPSKEYLQFLHLQQLDRRYYWQALHAAKVKEEATMKAEAEQQAKTAREMPGYIAFAVVALFAIVLFIYWKRAQAEAARIQLLEDKQRELEKQRELDKLARQKALQAAMAKPLYERPIRASRFYG